MKTLAEMYKYLYDGAVKYNMETRKEPDPDRIRRSATKYAVRHTVKCWRAQWK